MFKRMISRKAVRPVLLLFLVAGLGVLAERSNAQSSTAAKKKPAPTGGTRAGSSSKTSGSKARSGKKTSRKSRQRGQTTPTTDRISEIQAALAKDGSFKGTPNGKWDESTVEAVRKFQTAHGMNPTGRLDAPTLQKLGLGSSTTGVAPPQTPPGAVSKLSTSKFNSADPSSDNQR
ncbi:MAG TPA: peptidoglycan-binding domain-containing protein [Candidatus Acidoferrum sp.]|nr:peptidoglycan-binding domain-containing protein [Candidatus Acidoferrum sp.]